MKFQKFLILSLLSQTINATESIFKFGSNNFSGSITSTAKAFDRITGTIFVGTDATGGGDSTFAISSATRTSTAFTQIATNSLVNGEKINSIALLRNNGVNTEATHVTSVNETNSSELLILKISDKSVARTGVLTDGAGSLTDRITLVETSSMHAFARTVRAAGNEGAGNGSGIANIKVTADSPTVIQGSTTTAALTFDGTSEDGALSQVVTDVAFDEDLETLFITSTANINAGSTGFALIKAKFGVGGAAGNQIGLERSRLSTILPQDGNLDTIFGFNNTSGGAAVSVGLHKIKIMTTSTDLKYLIVNGGVFSGSSIAGNEFYSLRISQTGTGSIKPGDVIRFDRFFETQLPNDFTNTDNILSTSVGCGVAPWSNVISTTDMVVVDDAVYVSATGPQRSAAHDPGIWKSQALFDHEGKIISWTPWERVFPSVDNVSADNTPFFEVDARTGKLWRGNSDGTQVTRSKWNLDSSTATALQNRIAANLNDGCYTILDLPKNTPGIGATGQTDNSFTVFAGFEKVAFARTKNGAVNAITTDFSSADNFKLTTAGLSGFGPIRSLGYSYNNEPSATKGYFFAGTNKGLLAFAPSDGAGFSGATGLTDLDTGELFASAEDASWQSVASSILTTTSAISQIITCSGDNTYLLVLDTVSEGGITDHIYKMPLEDTIAALTPTIIASSGRGGLPDNALFSGCAIITTTNSQTADIDRMGCFGVLSTNDGIFTTTCDLRFLTLTDGEWESVVTTTGIPFHSIQSIKDHRIEAQNTSFFPNKNTSFFAIPFIDGSRNLELFENSTFLQAAISGNALRTNVKNGLNTIGTRAVQASPANFNDSVGKRRFALNKDSTNFKNVEFTTHFFTDGGRRFFVRFDPDISSVFSNIKQLPFKAAEWNMTEPEFDKILASIKRIHWIEIISGTGQLMAGTDDGVISLE